MRTPGWLEGRGWVVALVVLVGAVAGFAYVAWNLGEDEPPEPGPVADAFVTAWSQGDRDALDELVTDVAALDAVDPVGFFEDSALENPGVELTEVVEDTDRNGMIDAPITIQTGYGTRGAITWDSSLRLVQDPDTEEWLIEWTPLSLHPAMVEGATVQQSLTWPDRAPILGLDGEEIAGPVEEVLIGIEPRRMEDRNAVKAALSAELGVEPSSVDAALDAPGVEPDHFVPIVQVRRSLYEQVRDVIFPVPGLLFREVTGRGGPAPDFARHLVGTYGEVTAERLEQLGAPYAVGDLVGLSGLEASFEEQLAGRPAVDLTLVGPEGDELAELADFEMVEPEPLQTTIDPPLQLAAESAMANVEGAGAFVAVDPATGAVRAAVSRPLTEFDRAIGGAYPPGSTFKVVTAAALLSSGVTPDDPIDCPPEFVVEGRAFRNFEGGAAGRITFGEAVAQSCNTAIIGLASLLPDGALGAAAESFGFGVDYSLGPTTLGGDFPAPESDVERAAAAIGQGRVTASPLHMATVAAGVRDGTWRSPVLVEGSEASTQQVTRELDPAMVEQLRELMRRVVTSGTGTAANVEGLELIGKTGTAEYGQGDPPPTHAWFVAATPTVALSVLVEDRPAGGTDAAPIAASFLRVLPRS